MITALTSICQRAEMGAAGSAVYRLRSLTEVAKDVFLTLFQAVPAPAARDP